MSGAHEVRCVMHPLCIFKTSSSTTYDYMSLFRTQVQLSSEKLGQSVDECDALLKKHEAFERLIATQEEKVKY